LRSNHGVVMVDGGGDGRPAFLFLCDQIWPEDGVGVVFVFLLVFDGLVEIGGFVRRVGWAIS